MAATTFDLSSRLGWALFEMNVHDVARDVGRRGTVDWRGLDARGRLVLRLSARTAHEHLRGVACAANALSAEVCDQCSRPGDPVRLAADVDGLPVTRCPRCRGPADEVLPRPPWRRDRDPEREAVDADATWRSHRAYPVVEDVVGDDALAAFMEARDPAEHRGWPRTIVGTDHGLPAWTVGHAGWNRLIRAAFTVLLPMQCAGQARPLRITQVKESGGQLVIHGRGLDDPFRLGVLDLLARYSERVCIRCGEPGKLRNVRWVRPPDCYDCSQDDCHRHPERLRQGGWVRPECDGCWSAGEGRTAGARNV